MSWLQLARDRTDLKTSSIKAAAPPWCPEYTSSLTSVFLAVMFRLYDSDENGLLDQAVSSYSKCPS